METDTPKADAKTPLAHRSAYTSDGDEDLFPDLRPPEKSSKPGKSAASHAAEPADIDMEDGIDYSDEEPKPWTPITSPSKIDPLHPPKTLCPPSKHIDRPAEDTPMVDAADTPSSPKKSAKGARVTTS